MTAGAATLPVLRAQIRAEVTLTLRNGESLLVTLGIPIGLLVFFTAVDVLPTGDGDPVDFLAPGILALAVMSTSMVSTGIATGFERSYGVLKRLAVTPLGRPRLLAAKAVSVLVVEAVQFVLIITAALLLGWDAGSGLAMATGGVLLGTAAFAGLGFLLAGSLPALLNLAVVNALYLALLLTGGMVFELTELPGAVQAVARALPAAPLAEILQAGVGDAGDAPTRAWLVLGAWAVGAPTLAAATFKWE